MLTIQEARQLGAERLRIAPDVFNRSVEIAKEMDARHQDIGVVALALSIMGVAGVTEKKGMEDEFASALQLISMAEKEWRMAQDRRFH